MVSAGDFRNGLTIEFEGNVYQVIEFQHVKPGKGAAFVRTKLKNIKNGGVVEKTFRPTEKCPQAHIERQEMQYLYAWRAGLGEQDRLDRPGGDDARAADLYQYL